MISKEFKESVKDGDVVIVRSALLDDLFIDRTFKKFDEEFNEANSNNELKLLVPYDGKMIEADPEKWNMDYLNKQKVALMLNFSQQRIEHLKKVITKVMPPKVEKEKRAKNVVKEATNKNNPTEKRRETSQSTRNPNQKPEPTKGLTGRNVISVTETKTKNVVFYNIYFL